MEDFTEIVAAYYVEAHGELVKFVERRTGNHELAEDLVHDAFLRMLTTDKVIIGSTLPAMAYTILRNLLADHFRRVAYGKEYDGHLRHSVADGGDSASLCSLHEIEEWLERGLARLPERCREPYRLNICGGLKISEIQRATGEDYKRLEHSLGMARKEMRQYLKRLA